MGCNESKPSPLQTEPKADEYVVKVPKNHLRTLLLHNK